MPAKTKFDNLPNNAYFCCRVKDNSKHSELVEEMKSFFEDDKTKVGIFWYNYIDNVLFGVMKDDAEKYEKEKGWGTLPKLHKTYWQKHHHRAVAKGLTDSIFYEKNARKPTASAVG